LAHFSLYLPDALHARARREIPDAVPWSLVFREAVLRELGEAEAADRVRAVLEARWGEARAQVQAEG
jgi:hypothetical protein